ncbi:TonB-dependent receptor plug domain-containing protein [uncultured Chryseobacterium sp.]|uniref:TonB-dependent receptor plug domain-containing protein n=1 Tax=uncultured Chryseobacterium sp. TaxID=259322 RepID=UPI0025CDEE74|nr:TonB-dependent receptor plug domain-containing protein [uncultured Chryseobacterium sp.]
MKLRIPAPCHENWETMSPAAKGKFCAACAKTVTDFTGASDEEIMEVLSADEENTCGNFKASQLNRDLRYSGINSVFARLAVGCMVTAAGLVSVNAQQHYGPEKDSLKEKRVKGKAVPGVIKNDAAMAKNFILGGIHKESLDKYRSPLYVINGKPGTEADFKALDPHSISKINVLKGEYATERYGQKAGNGAIEITTKRRKNR